MTKRARTAAWAAAALLVLAVLWYLFRPETLFIDKTVDEPFPGTGTSGVESQGTEAPRRARLQKAAALLA